MQHILYGKKDLKLIGSLFQQSVLNLQNLQLLFVFGRYTAGQQSDPEDLTPFVDWTDQTCPDADWGVCAFGGNETLYPQAVQALGRAMHVGFETSFQNANGSIAQNNAKRVAEIARICS